MNLLIVNLDKNIFSKDSSSLARLKEYSELVDKIFVIVWTLKKEKPIEYNNKLFIYPTNSKYKFKYYLDTIRMFREIKKKNKVDLMFTQDPFETGLAGWIIAKIFKIPLQLQVHTEFSSVYFKHESFANKLRFYLTKFLIPRANHIRTVSNRFKRMLVNKYKVDEKKITAVPIYSNIKSKFESPACAKASAGRQKSKVREGKFIFLTVSRLVPVKNISMQINAMAGVVKKYPETELWVVGDGVEREKLKLQITNYKLQNNIKLLGWHNNLEKFYKEADTFLLTSNYEGWGMVIVEAASYGLPIIMTDVGCAGEIIKDGESGIVIPVGEDKKLEEEMIRLIENDELRKHLGNNSQKAILNLPTKKETLKLYLKSWEKTVNK